MEQIGTRTEEVHRDGSVELSASAQPLVTIVTPCLNPGDRLTRCIENVADQTYGQIEHLIIDGGSRDETLTLLRATAGVRWISEPDPGQASAINKGFRMARGTLLAWLGADDLLEPRATEQAVEALSQHPEAGFAYGKVRIAEPRRSFVVDAPRRLRNKDFDFFNPIWQPGSIIRRETIEAVGGLDESLHYALDFDLWLRVFDTGAGSVYIPRVLATYEVHPDSKTGAANIGDFVMDCYRSFLKTGRRSQAAMALGRAAAYRAAQAGRVDKRRLEEELQAHLSQGVEDGIDSPPKTIAAARTEAALIELQRSNNGMRHLLSPGPWIYHQTRRRLALAASRAIRRGRLPMPGDK